MAAKGKNMLRGTFILNEIAMGIPVILITLLGSPGVPVGAPQDTSTMGATGSISNPINLNSDSPINFGEVKSGVTDGTVILSPDPLVPRIPTGGARIDDDDDDDDDDDWAPAFVSVTGAANTSFTVLFPEMVQVVFHDESTQHFLDATFFTSESDTLGGTASGVGLTDAAGNDTVRVGGTLLIPAGSKNGEYEGTINLQVLF